MKSRKGILAAALLTVVLCMAGCGSPDKEGTSGETPSGGGYSFTSGSTKIEMGKDASKIVEALGDADDYFESESCAFEGLDKVYSYPGFKLNTYPEDDKDYVLSVVFMDDTVSTDEGISIGSTKDAVTKAYGDAEEESASRLVYKAGDTKMTIGLNGDRISSIEISLAGKE